MEPFYCGQLENGPAPALPIRLTPDPVSKKARERHLQQLKAICAQHGTSPEDSRVSVEPRRKVIHVLNVGEPTSPVCFLSIPLDRSDKMQTVLIPDSWKVAVVAEGQLWVAEAKVIAQELRYRFSLVDEHGIEQPCPTVSSPQWLSKPTRAFKETLIRTCPDVSQATLRKLNGSLLLGCQYETVQDKLREYFVPRLQRNMYDETMQDLMWHWVEHNPFKEETLRYELENFIFGTEEELSTHELERSTPHTSTRTDGGNGGG